MDWRVSRDACSKLCGFLGIGSAGASSSSGSKALLLEESKRPKQISEHIFEICNNTKPERWSAEIVCFHGLELENSSEPHITTWLSRNKTDLWLNWLQEDFPNVRILTVRYDASLVRTANQGILDLYQTCENLLGELTGGGGSVGKAECPIILVGHCLGGLVLKGLLLMASNKLGLQQNSGSVKPLLLNVKGILCYATPHHGSELLDCTTRHPKGSLFKDLDPLNKKRARSNSDFYQLRTKYKWRSVGLGEACEVTLNQFKGLVVTEASSRDDVDDYYTADANHFDVCRPESRTSRSYTLLADLIDNIIQEWEGSMPVLGNVPENLENPVGLNSRIRAIRKELQAKTRIAIVGMGGVGKTTLAVGVYKRIAKEFEYSCFFHKVKDSYNTKGATPQNLRKKITTNLVDRNGRRVDKPFQWNQLKGRNVLIILDDAESEAQVMVMTKEDGFLAQSRVIITSRDRGFIERGFTEEADIHVVEALDYDSSKELFCRCAFKKTEPPVPFREHVNDILKKCGGLPLALTITGKYLRHQRKDIWTDALIRLCRAKDLNGRGGFWSLLNPIYESLAQDEKEMFLDAATCFHGKPLEEVQKVWKVCRETPSIAWKNLLDLHLVKTRQTWDHSETWYGECVSVHEVLRSLGHELAGCSRMSLAYGDDDIRKIAKLSDEGAKSVKVVAGPWPCFPYMLTKLTKLEILWLDNSYAGHIQTDHEGDQESFDGSIFTDMVFVSAGSVPSRILKAIFGMKSLQGLTFNDKYSPDFPSTLWAHIRNLQQLQYLEPTGNLVIELLPHICHLQELQHLKISGSWLEAIPEEICQLSRLQTLIIERPDLQVIPKTIGKLQGLESLIMSTEYLEAIPNEIGGLVELEELNISECSRLRAIPEGISKLQRLKSLKISGCDYLEAIPNEIGGLVELEVLNVSGCRKVRAIPEGISNLQWLQSLAISDCRNMETISNGISTLSGLQSLAISGCPRLEAIPEGIGRLVNLKTLDISRCREKVGASPREIGQLQNLESLRVPIHDTLKMTPARIGQLQSPLRVSQFLDRSRCANLMAILPEIGKLHKLKSIDISHHVDLTAIGKEEDKVESSYILDITRDYKRMGIPAELNQLKTPKLNISYQFLLLDISASHFELVQMTPIDLGSWEASDHGRTVEIMSCGDFVVTGDRGINSYLCVYFESLTISGCDLEAIPLDRSFLFLRHLNVFGCHNLKSIPSTALLSLRSLNISGCSKLEVIPSVWLLSLRSVDISGCNELKVICTAKIRPLESLKISGCSKLEVIPYDSDNLVSLSICGCSKLVIPEETLEAIYGRGGSVSIVDG